METVTRPGGSPAKRRVMGPDLRRIARRDLAALLVQRAASVGAFDRALIEAVFGDGVRVSRLARLMGRDVRVLRRRVKRVARLLLSERFTFITSHSRDWSPTRRRLATACVLHGRPIREAAAELGVTLHAARREVDAVKAIYGHIMREG